MPAPADLTFRDEPRAADLQRVREIVETTGFFSAEEVRIAIELVDDRLARGPASDYRFLFAETDGAVAGYSCYGPIALTKASWDLYWIAVDPAAQGKGVGKALLAESERRIALAGGERVYAETSSRAQYLPTRGFYELSGYAVGAILDDFYAPGDGKVIFVRTVGAAASVAPASP
jgi:ribosomal protein S18 acetylase RimI-like enzyme